MHAVMRSGGHQYRVTEGDVLDVERLSTPKGERIEIEDVLLTSDGANVRIGTPVVKNAKVVARVLDHPLGDKITVAKFKKRKRYRRKQGHRQKLTRLKIEEIVL